ncbi:hypothetical protein OAO87_03095, partial [bacterium]|nr:hypothetical protein [bacterium]
MQDCHVLCRARAHQSSKFHAWPAPSGGSSIRRLRAPVLDATPPVPQDEPSKSMPYTVGQLRDAVLNPERIFQTMYHYIGWRLHDGRYVEGMQKKKKKRPPKPLGRQTPV